MCLPLQLQYLASAIRTKKLNEYTCAMLTVKIKNILHQVPAWGIVQNRCLENDSKQTNLTNKTPISTVKAASISKQDYF